MTRRLEPGDAAPGFRLLDEDGRERTLADFAGTGLVLYFYPNAFTPGCTTEACDFRDSHDAFRRAGFAVVGVSPDPPDELAAFRREHGLPFSLLSDPDHAVASAYGAWGTKKLYGREVEGMIRSTIAIAGDGTVTAAWYNVRARGHVARVGAAIT